MCFYLIHIYNKKERMYDTFIKVDSITDSIRANNIEDK